jgi:hypothetical protein
VGCYPAKRTLTLARRSAVSDAKRAFARLGNASAEAVAGILVFGGQPPSPSRERFQPQARP